MIESSASRAPKSSDILEFVHLLLVRAKTRAKHEELRAWRTTHLTPMIQCLSEQIDKVRALFKDAVRDDTQAPDALNMLTKLCDKSKNEWTEAFTGDDSKEHREQVAEALQQLQQESSQLEMKNLKLLTQTPATLEYMSPYMTYLVATSLEASVSDVSALARSAVKELQKAVDASQAEKRIVSDQDDGLNTATGSRHAKRVRVEEKKQDPEHKDVRGALAWVISLDGDVHMRLHRLRESVPTPRDFEKAREQAYSFAIYIDYANWVLNVLRLVGPRVSIIDASAGVKAEPTYIQWLQKHEQQVRDRAAIEVDSQRRQAVAVVDSLYVRLQDLGKWYSDLLTEILHAQDNIERDLLAIHKPWNEKSIPEDSKSSLPMVFADVKKGPEGHIRPCSDHVNAAAWSVAGVAIENQPVTSTTYRALQPEVEMWLLGTMGLWLHELV